MFKIFPLLIFFLMLLVCQPVFAQITFTSNGTCASNNPNYFGTASCWTATSLNGCAIPGIPTTSGTSSCPVTFEVNHVINIGNLAIGNHFTLQVNLTGSLNLTGDLTKTADTNGNILVDGGDIQIGGNLVLPNGKQNSNTILNVDIRKNGTFHVNGGILDVRNDAVLNISGDGNVESSLIVKTLEFGQRSQINIASGGGLIVEGLTDFTGNNSSINVEGFFETGGVLIRGGAGNQLNTIGDAEVLIINDLDVRGNSEISFGGNSEIDIGGNIRVEGGSKVTAKETAKVYVCGTYPDPETTTATEELLDGQFIPSCRILPVDLINFEVEQNNIGNFSLLTWSTAKEWENSHFEIERSEMNIKRFKKIGQVKGVGWTETKSSYSYEDKNLPISGGMVYYRLKQVDFNGNFEYSSVVSVNLPKLQVTNGIWRAYPNPTENGQLRVSLLDRDGYNEESLTFRLIHPTSVTESMSVSNEDEMNEILATWVAKIPRGLFVVEIRWGQKVEHIKVLKK